MSIYLWVLHAYCLLWMLLGWSLLRTTTQPERVTPQAVAVWMCAAGLFAIAAVLS